MSQRVLVAPLNWGLGHATRMVPIIRNQLNEGNEVILASDGLALRYLHREFPELTVQNLPAYNVKYNTKSLIRGMMRQIPSILQAVRAERIVTKDIVSRLEVDRVISDNRYGVWDPRVHNTMITHQLNFPGLSGWAGRIASWQVKRWLRPFDEIWIPDDSGESRITGKMSESQDPRVQYIGPLSRFEKVSTSRSIPLLVVLSGPEPARTVLEHKVIDAIGSREAVMVRGVESEPGKSIPANIEVHNLLNSHDLNKLLCSAELVVARCGYSTIMDLVKLNKPAILIPTPGQPEQLYLAQQVLEHPIFTVQTENRLDFSQNDVA